MDYSVNKIEAEQVLLEAFRNRCVKSDKTCQSIFSVLNGSHKTYKYILLTGLLAKASNKNINPIALQAGAPIIGAYDARSLCHNVIVPFERTFLQNALGGSNEPFLNKPARFTHLAKENAVRKGKDKETLFTLIEIFEKVKSSKSAKEYLSCALEFLNRRIIELTELNDSTTKYDPSLIEIYEFILNFLTKSFEGETSVLVVGALEKIYYNKLGSNYRVIVHKVNQSGTSSKEIGDIDIYNGADYLYSIEIKDKDFTEYDVEHAFSKILKANGKKGEFIYSNHSMFDLEKINSKLVEFEKNGFYTLVHSIIDYCKHTLIKIEIENKKEFVEKLFETSTEINCKEVTKKWIHELLNHLNWK